MQQSRLKPLREPNAIEAASYDPVVQYDMQKTKGKVLLFQCKASWVLEESDGEEEEHDPATDVLDEEVIDMSVDSQETILYQDGITDSAPAYS